MKISCLNKVEWKKAEPFEEAVKVALEMITPKSIKNILTANKRYIKSLLQENLISLNEITLEN